MPVMAIWQQNDYPGMTLSSLTHQKVIIVGLQFGLQPRRGLQASLHLGHLQRSIHLCLTHICHRQDPHAGTRPCTNLGPHERLLLAPITLLSSRTATHCLSRVSKPVIIPFPRVEPGHNRVMKLPRVEPAGSIRRGPAHLLSGVGGDGGIGGESVVTGLGAPLHLWGCAAVTGCPLHRHLPWTAGQRQSTGHGQVGTKGVQCLAPCGDSRVLQTTTNECKAHGVPHVQHPKQGGA